MARYGRDHHPTSGRMDRGYGRDYGYGRGYVRPGLGDWGERYVRSHGGARFEVIPEGPRTQYRGREWLRAADIMTDNPEAVTPETTPRRIYLAVEYTRFDREREIRVEETIERISEPARPRRGGR